MTGLLSLKGLVKKYEYEMEEERIPLQDVVAQTFHILGGLVDQCLGVRDAVALEILYIVSKIFYLGNQLIITPCFTKKETLAPWMGLFKTLMDLELDEELTRKTEIPEEIEAKDGSWYWRLKGISARATHRVVSKYGNPKFVEEKNKAFSDMLATEFGIPLL